MTRSTQPGGEGAGERQFGPYRLVRRIATGGMAEIHLARKPGFEGFEKHVALKMIHPNFSADDHFIQMLIDEAKISVQLQHANIAQTFDLGRVGDTYYIVMEYVDGSDLFRVLRKASEQDRFMPVEMAIYVAKEVANGLDYAHTKRDANGRSMGIIHRDVSPQNVLISHAGEVKIVDFGIAKATMRAKQTAVGVIKGKYYYMSPEQAWGDKLDHRTDIFSAGILLYEMLTGQMLYLEEDMNKLLDMVRRADIPPPSSKRREVPRELDKLVMRALAKKPDLRWQSAHDFGTELEKFLHGYAPDFTASKLAVFVGQALAVPAPAPAPAPAPPPAPAIARQSIAASRAEFNDENSIIFNLADRVASPPPRAANRLTTPSALPPSRQRPAAPNRETRPSGRAVAESGPRPAPPKLPEPKPLARAPVPSKPNALAARLAGSSTHNMAMSDLVDSEPTSASPPPKPPPKPPVPTETAILDDEDLLEVDDEERAAAPPAPATQETTREATAESTGDLPTTVGGPATIAAQPDEDPTQIDVASLSRRPSRNQAAQPPPPVLSPPAPARPTRRTPGSVPVVRPPESSSPPSALPLVAQDSDEYVLPAAAAQAKIPTPPPARASSSPAVRTVWPPVTDEESGDWGSGVRVGPRIGARQVLLGLFGLCGLLGIGALGVAVFSSSNAPRYATLEVISIPTGATVSVDGKALGHTPVALERVPLQRPLTLRVELDRHLAWEREERFDEPRHVKIVASLKPILGTLRVDSTPLGAEVFVDNRSVGLTPLVRADLSPFSDGFVEVRKQGFKPQRLPLEWRGQRQVSLRVELQPAKD